MSSRVGGAEYSTELECPESGMQIAELGDYVLVMTRSDAQKELERIEQELSLLRHMRSCKLSVRSVVLRFGLLPTQRTS